MAMARTASGAWRSGEDIVLFGEGEERRDHVLVEDVAEMVVRMLRHRSRGVLNVATGEVHSFRDVAARAIALAGDPRRFRIAAAGADAAQRLSAVSTDTVRAAFPDFRYTRLAEGMARAQQASVRTCHDRDRSAARPAEE